MEKEIYIKFLYNGNVATEFSFVVQDGKFAYATNKYSILRWEPESFDPTWKPVPSIMDISEFDWVGARLAEITLSECEAFLNSVPTVKEDIFCEECSGRGLVEWTYKEFAEDYNCPACYGRGSFFADREVPDPTWTMEVGGKFFFTHSVELIVMLMKRANIDKIMVKFCKMTMIVINFPDCDMLFMSR